jgi:hypothetical protein
MTNKKDEDTMLEGFVDLVKLLDDHIASGEHITMKKLSLDDHFKEVIANADLIEQEAIKIKILEEEYYGNLQLHARRTSGRRARWHRYIDPKFVPLTPATLTSVLWAITRNSAGYLQLNGTNFGTSPVTIKYSSGGTSAEATVTPDGTGTQAIPATPAIIYGLAVDSVVAITLVNGSGIASNALNKTVVGAGFTPVPVIASIAGNIQHVTSTSLVLTGTHFHLGIASPVIVRFTIGAVDTDVTVTPSLATELTVAVPAAVYNEPVDTVVGIKIIRSGIQSNTIAKTIIA